MKKFMVLYMAPYAAMQEMMKNATPETMQAGMEDWNRWGQKYDDAIVDMGAPLGKTKSVTSDGAMDTHNDLGGYSIVEGSSADEVAEMFDGHPHLKMGNGAKIEIIEIMPMSGM